MSTNPYLVLRKELRRSQDQLARAAGVGINVVKKTEYGMFLEPPPSVTFALVRGHGAAQLPSVNVGKLLESYHAWQSLQRKQNKPLFQGLPLNNGFLIFRQSLGPAYHFARLLAYDLGMLQHYEKDGSRAERLYDALSEVLSEGDLQCLRKSSQ